MPSRLTCLTFEVNQKLNDILLPFPIRWNVGRQRWEKDKEKEAHYYSVQIVTLVVWILMCVGVIKIHLQRPGLFDASQIIVIITQMVTAVPCLAFALITMQQTDTVVELLNVVVDLEKDKWFQVNIIPHCGSGATVRLRLGAVVNSFLDSTGIVLFNCVFLTITAGATIAAFIITVKGWEPIYLLMLVHGQENLVANTPMTIARGVVWLFIVNVSYSIEKYNALFHMYGGMTIYRLLHLIRKATPKFNKASAHKFRQLAIILNEYHPVFVPLTPVVLSTLFFILVFGANLAIIGIFLTQAVLTSLGATIVFVSVELLDVVFFICCHIPLDSSALLHTWISDRKNDGGYASRVVKGMRVLSIPVGIVGIIDKDIQMNYFAKVISYVADVRIICKKVLLT